MEATRTVTAAQPQCPECDGPMSKSATRRMRCEYARRGPVKKRPCVECGKSCRGERCRSCWKADSNVAARRIPRRDARTSCSVPDCGGAHQAQGYCEKHYTRLKRHGDPLVVIRPRGTSRPVCGVCGGRKKQHDTQLCRSCWRESVRNDTPCIVKGCEEPHASKGYCRKHGHRVARYGDPHVARLRSIDIVAALPQPEGDCIEWPRLTPSGYGRAVYKGKAYPAHRLVWEQRIGRIPAGLELDHLCCNRACVNTNHLEPVSGAENKRRRWARWWARQEAA